MKRMTDKTKRILFWTMYVCAQLLLIAAFVIGFIGLKKSNSSLTLASNILIPCGLLLNVINVFAFKPNGRKVKKDNSEESKK